MSESFNVLYRIEFREADTEGGLPWTGAITLKDLFPAPPREGETVTFEDEKGAQYQGLVLQVHTMYLQHNITVYVTVRRLTPDEQRKALLQ